MSMKSDGETFKMIRKSRNIRQQDICKNRISRTTISKFENNRITLTMSNFKYVLDTLDVSMEEFYFIKNNYSYDKKELIIYEFNSLFSNINETVLNNLITRCSEYLSQEYSKSIKCILNVLLILKHINNSSYKKIDCLARVYAADIWMELSKVDEWTILDIKIINCCLQFFEKNTVKLIAEQLILNLKKYATFENISTIKTSIYSNVTLIFLIDKIDENLEEYSNKALKFAYESKRIDYLSIALIRNGIVHNDSKKIEKGFNLLSYLDDNKLIKEINNEYIFLSKMDRV